MRAFGPAIVVSVLFAGSFIAGKVAVGAVRPLTLTLFRYTIALLVLGVLLAAGGKRRVTARDDLRAQITGMTAPVVVAILYMGVLASGIGYLLYNMSVREIGPTGTAGIVYSLVPVLVAVVSIAVFAEELSPVVVGSCLLVVTGLWLMLRARPVSKEPLAH